MTGSLPPPGWYPDPSDDQQLRWWTGERWTGAARPIEPPQPASPMAGVGHVGVPRDQAAAATPAASQVDPEPADPWSAAGAATWVDEPDDDRGAAGWPKERLIAAIAIGGLLATSLVIWLVAVVLQGGDEGAGPGVTVDDPAGDESAAGDEGAGDEGAGDEGAGDGGDGGGGTTDGDGAAEGDAAADDDGDAGGEDEQEADDEQEVRTVDFDGVCSVEVAVAEVDGDTPLRPWQFEECERAPVNLDSGERWIVVIASVDGDQSEAQALERARSYDQDYGLLWSTHYPSLNPGWWVVYDGPFSSEDDATDAADEAGGGSYPRQLTDDEDDRYCIAEDGC